MEVIIIGAGTYGCYLANILSKKYNKIKIYLIEVGNSETKTEAEIGYKSLLKKDIYNGASKGRYFGLGGTSEKWGGQLLFFSTNDCINDPEMEEIKNINVKYKNSVLKRFFSNVPDIKEKKIQNDLYVKSGIWLKYNKRNLYKLFNIEKNQCVTLISNSRVISINNNGEKVESITILQNNIKKNLSSDIYFITAGAFETMRLLNVSGMINTKETSLGFSDHISKKCFKILSNKALIENHDFSYNLIEKSLITSRIIGEINGSSFFLHPVFNERFALFQIIKDFLFKGKVNFRFQILPQIFHLIPFVLSYYFKNKIYIYKDWDLYIDIEIDTGDNQIELGTSLDKFGEKIIEISYKIPETTIEKIELANNRVRGLLKKNHINFIDLYNDPTCNKLEDAYHPFKLYDKGTPWKKRVNPLSNLYSIHTGILPRAGGINPTASLFCLLEEIVDNKIV